MINAYSASTKTDAVQAAQNELARRARLELARRNPAQFAAYIDPQAAGQYRAAHLQLIGRYIADAEIGTLWRDVAGSGRKILIVTTPPRHWKSSLVSQKAAAWFVGRRASNNRPHQIIFTSYAAGLATRNSRAALEAIRDNARFRDIFPDVKVSMKSQSVEEWALKGEPIPTGVAAGVGGGLTGHGADMLIIDDPIKDATEAASLATRQRLWEWWSDVARTRVNPGGFVIIIMTRWHVDDLVGRLLEQAQTEPEMERIVHLRLPALAETDAERVSAGDIGLPVDEADPLGRRPGEALWPEQVGAEEHLVTARLFPLTHNALNQGRPVPKGGYLVGRDAFHMLDSKPAQDVRWCWGTDWAITEKEAAPKRKQEPDYTVAFLVGLWTPQGDRNDMRLILADMRRAQVNIFEAKELVSAAMKSTGPTVPMRSGQANMDKIYLTSLRSRADLIQYSIRNLKRDQMPGDKVARANRWIELVHAGRVYVVRGAWNDAFFSEMESFPRGSHDDQIDAISVAVAHFGIDTGSHKTTSSRVKFYE